MVVVGEHREFQIKLPMRMNVSKSKIKPLNMNVYRNLHFHSLNYQKKSFYELVKPLLQGLPEMEGITLDYKIFPQTKRLFDVVNIGSIVDKYFSDSLVTENIIPDDNYKHLGKVTFSFGGCVVTNEYVLVTITETEPRRNTMRVILDQNDIQIALETYVETQGITGASGVELSVSDGEIVAEVTIGDVTPKPTTTTAPKRRGGRPVGSKNKLKEPVEDVAAPDETNNSDDKSGSVESPKTETATTKTSGESTKEEEGKDPKNPFGESPEESSKGDTEVTKESNGSETTPEVKKGVSIFDT